MSLSQLTTTATRAASGAVRLGASVAGRALGLAKGVAEVGVAVARDAAASRSDAPSPAPTQRTTSPEPEPVRPTEPERDDPRDHIPGPDVVAPDLPRAEDLPEPVVIEATDDEPGEAFQHEPKAAGRDSEHEGRPGDREEAAGYLDEVVDPDAPEVDVETPVGTTGADVATNPDTAESDLQQPGTPPLADPSTIAAVVSESETLRRAAERDPGA